MAEKLNPKRIVDFKELMMSRYYSIGGAFQSCQTK